MREYVDETVSEWMSESDNREALNEFVTQMNFPRLVPRAS